jgi:hypothetical protein
VNERFGFMNVGDWVVNGNCIVGGWELGVGSWEFGGGSWELRVGSWEF